MKKTKQKKERQPYNIDAIQRRVIDDIRRPMRTLADLESFLIRWWCRQYNKPYKCAEVQEYTLEELMYEYFDVSYRANPEAMKKYLDEQGGKLSEDEEWLRKMMGGGYATQTEQEQALSGMKKEIDDATEDEEDINFNFEEFR